jgi:hypothetical protein
MHASKPGDVDLDVGVVPQPMAKSKPADPEIGAPGNPSLFAAPGWHSRGYIPHFESAEVIQHVTFHLADSLPKKALRRLQVELKLFPEGKRDAARRKRIEAWANAGHGSCILREPHIAGIVQSAFLLFDGKRYRLIAWVVMPNHVHVLIQPIAPRTVAMDRGKNRCLMEDIHRPQVL